MSSGVVVADLFDDLTAIGLDCFNPFQPEVIDIPKIHAQYRGRLSFFWGLSMQKNLPYGTVADVVSESRALLEMGRSGNYIFSLSHAVEGDTSMDNIIAFIREARAQSGLPDDLRDVSIF
ncbi:hypothetical protein [Geminisphaera colitermitum]|uniref:hypothetical protein n=1 Tax=Geminisphaera colitermitum TaxID=1148786 RepID=UPI0001964F9B|nr:hypothetical protein [Geminisphaera colitermitum]